jgi:hypothetical protein
MGEYRGRGHGIKTPALLDEIIERVSLGEPLAQVCREERMPNVNTVARWMADDRDFEQRFARARAVGYDAIAAECMKICDEENIEDVQRAKLRVETRLKLLAKWDPKRYGDRLQHTGDGGGPIQVNFYIPDNGRDKPSGD